jgi:hypothetical protein
MVEEKYEEGARRTVKKSMRESGDMEYQGKNLYEEGCSIRDVD